MIFENNIVSVTGKIVSPFEFDHEFGKEKFYTATIAVKRLSGNTDKIPLLVSERLLNMKQDYKIKAVKVVGEYRSYNYHENGITRLLLRIFVKEIELSEDIADFNKDNQIYLDGYICKEVIYRKTPLGREIADLLLAVNRPYGKSDYIPCIAWGRNARYASGFAVGSRVRVWGRVQSREYTKKLSETQCEKRVAYEVSIRETEVIEDEN